MINNKDGFSIVEILIVVGITSVMIVSVAKAMESVNKLNIASEIRPRLSGYAQESIEIINTIKNDIFACTCATDSCSGDVCSRISDGQSCTMFNSYTSCWTEYPKGLVGEIEFYLDDPGGNWGLFATSTSVIIVDGSRQYFHIISITNAKRDVNSDISLTGTSDFNTKIIDASVWALDRGITHRVNLKTILTGWENL